LAALTHIINLLDGHGVLLYLRRFMRNGGRRPFRQRYRQPHSRIGVVQASIRREVLDQGELHRVALCP